jgi:tripartite-type tricarboxylate transporter receptor subunit TctC
MMTKSPRAAAIAFCFVLLLSALAESRAAGFPDHPIKLIVPFPAGASTDGSARSIQPTLEKLLGQPVIIENRAGAGAVIGMEAVAKSPPDGYTIMMSVSSLAIDATLYKKLPYDPGKDLALIALIARVPFVLVVNPSLPVQNVEELIKLAKQRPLSYGSGGIGAFHHLCGALFSSMTGIKMTHVPYRGTAPALNDLIGGYLQVMFSDLGPALPFIKAGKLRALGVTTTRRFAALPDVPPLAEAGVPGFNAAAWQGVVAPAHTPAPIVAKLNSELNAIVAMDDTRSRMADLGMNPVGTGTPEELQRFLQDDIVRWGKVVEEAGIAHSE